MNQDFDQFVRAFLSWCMYAGTCIIALFHAIPWPVEEKYFNSVWMAVTIGGILVAISEWVWQIPLLSVEQGVVLILLYRGMKEQLDNLEKEVAGKEEDIDRLTKEKNGLQSDINKKDRKIEELEEVTRDLFVDGNSDWSNNDDDAEESDIDEHNTKDVGDHDDADHGDDVKRDVKDDEQHPAVGTQQNIAPDAGSLLVEDNGQENDESKKQM